MATICVQITMIQTLSISEYTVYCEIEANYCVYFQHFLWCHHISHKAKIICWKYRYDIFIIIIILNENSGSVLNDTLCICTLLLCLLFTLYIWLSISTHVYMWFLFVSVHLICSLISSSCFRISLYYLWIPVFK